MTTHNFDVEILDRTTGKSTFVPVTATSSDEAGKIAANNTGGLVGEIRKQLTAQQIKAIIPSIPDYKWLHIFGSLHRLFGIIIGGVGILFGVFCINAMAHNNDSGHNGNTEYGGILAISIIFGSILFCLIMLAWSEIIFAFRDIARNSWKNEYRLAMREIKMD